MKIKVNVVCPDCGKEIEDEAEFDPLEELYKSWGYTNAQMKELYKREIRMQER